MELHWHILSNDVWTLLQKIFMNELWNVIICTQSSVQSFKYSTFPLKLIRICKLHFLSWQYLMCYSFFTHFLVDKNCSLTYFYFSFKLLSQFQSMGIAFEKWFYFWYFRKWYVCSVDIKFELSCNQLVS